MTYVERPEGWRKLEEAFAHGILNLAFFAETEAKRNAPVLTGNLRRSIHAVVYNDGKVVGRDGEDIPSYSDTKGIVGYVGTNCGYGAFQELGTRFMSAHPFLRPGAEAATARGTDLIRAGMSRFIG